MHTVSDSNEVLGVKQEESKTNFKEQKKAIPCKYYNNIKGCRRGSKCWFSHDEKNLAEKNSTKFNQNLTKKFKYEQNIVKESNQEQVSILQQVLIELLKLLLRESNI